MKLSPTPAEGYFSIAPTLDRQDLNIIVDLLFAITSQMLGPTGLKQKNMKWFGHSFADLCTWLWIMVSGSGLLRQSCDHNQHILEGKMCPTGRVLL